jgi:5'-nucleotidase
VNNLRAVRSRDGGAVVLVDAGDMWQGTLESNLSEGASVVAAYNALGYAAAAVGNHEFDFGPAGPEATPRTASDDPRGALKARAEEARFPLLAANLIDASTRRPVEWPNFKPAVLVETGGVQIGIVGVMTREALSATITANTGGLSIAPLGPAIASQASWLREKGADIVVVAAHAGGRCSRFGQPMDLTSCESESEIAEVARSIPAKLVDVIVAGHTHAGMAHEIEGIAVIETFSGGRAFGRVDVIVDRSTNRVIARRIFEPQDLCAAINAKTQACDPGERRGDVRVAPRYEGAPVSPDATISALLIPAIEQARERQAAKLGVVLETPIRRVGGVDVESPLGNLFTDALRESIPGAGVAINNTSGGLRADLPRGPLTYGSVFKMFPFDNRIVSLNLSGAELRQLFATQLQRSEDLLGISGVRVQARCSGNSLIVTLLHASGQLVRDQEKLVVVTTDFLATSPLFARLPPAQNLKIPDDAPLARDVVADWLRRRGGTLREDQLINPGRPRWTHPGTRPVQCRAGG